MAVAHSSAASPAKTTTKTKKRKNTEQEEDVKTVPHASNPKQDSDLENTKQPKRTKSPGVRVVGGRIYDSSNGRTCHQCRQKTLDLSADCKNMINDKLCRVKLCHKCLCNRYGEKAEEVALLDDWKCPKCRGICNCSICMKKRGCQPTGMLIHNAKASGFSSVSELLNGQSPKSLSQEDMSKSKSCAVTSPKKVGKENRFNGDHNNLSKTPSKKVQKVEDLTMKKDVNGISNLSSETIVVKKIMKGPSEFKIDEIIKDESEVKNETDKLASKTGQVNKAQRKNSTKIKKVNEIKESTVICETEKAKLEFREVRDAERGCHALNNANESVALEKALKKKAKSPPNDHDVLNEKPKEVKIILPNGNELTNIAELDLLPGDVGNVLQLVEFCYTFGEVLKIRKGQIESVLRDMRLGRNRRGKVSSLVQLKIQLLTLIREDMGEESPLSPTDGKDCWLHALKECVSESEYVAKDLAALDFDRTDKYDMLSSSDKLKLLVFLSDEILETSQVRKWMEEENLKFSEKKKEAKEKVLAAKEKEKLAKRKLQDEVAKAILAKNGAPLSIAEHEALVSEMKTASELAHAEMLDAMVLLPKDDFTPDAIRIKPAFIDSEGHVCWKLKGFKKSEFLRQEIQCRDDSKASDKWFSYEEEKDVQVVNDYISASRADCRIQRRKYKKKTAPKVENANLNPQTNMNISTTTNIM